jgi:two-component system sensor histidine kinase PilS (NtrC family)
MNNGDLNNPTTSDLGRRLRWLMLFRVATATFLLGTTIMVHFRQVGGVSDTALSALYTLIGAIYFLTFVSAVVLPRLMGEHLQAYVQIVGDILITTAVIYLTGGLESAFSFMYILTIINAGLLLKTRGAVLTASFSAILYGTLLDLHYYRYISPYLTRFSYLDHYRATDIIITILVNMGAFYLVAVLSGYLSKQAEESRLKLQMKESDLERLEDLNESIIQSIDTGLMTLDSSGRIWSFNSAAERITGFEYAQVKGRDYREVFPDLRLGDDPGANTDLTPKWSWNYKGPDGREMILDLGLLGLKDRSNVTWGRLLVFEDKTRMKQMEEEVKRVERLAAIGEMAAGIAHEIRNPLASMSGSFQMLEADLNKEGDQGRLTAIMRREMDRLNHIVNDFLSFARPRTASPVAIDLSHVVDELLRMFVQQLGPDGNVQLIKKIKPEVLVLFDRHQIEQIMWNLLRNALEAMPAGGTLTVVVDQTGELPPMGYMRVSDTGPGISSDNMDRLFDPFFTTKAQGSGLGLSIVYRLLERGGGRIDVTSRPAEGAMFTIYLPLADPDPL